MEGRGHKAGRRVWTFVDKMTHPRRTNHTMPLTHPRQMLWMFALVSITALTLMLWIASSQSKSSKAEWYLQEEHPIPLPGKPGAITPSLLTSADGALLILDRKLREADPVFFPARVTSNLYRIDRSASDRKSQADLMCRFPGGVIISCGISLDRVWTGFGLNSQAPTPSKVILFNESEIVAVRPVGLNMVTAGCFTKDSFIYALRSTDENNILETSIEKIDLSGAFVQKTVIPDEISDLKCVAGSSTVVATMTNSIAIVDSNDFKVYRILKWGGDYEHMRAQGTIISPSGDYVLTSTNEGISKWDVETGDRTDLVRLSGPERHQLLGFISSEHFVSFSQPDQAGEHRSGFQNPEICIWRTTPDAAVQTRIPANDCREMTMSSNEIFWIAATKDTECIRSGSLRRRTTIP